MILSIFSITDITQKLFLFSKGDVFFEATSQKDEGKIWHSFILHFNYLMAPFMTFLLNLCLH